jgi:ATP-dependent exoDNAse (exonuclease V) beta subunit
MVTDADARARALDPTRSILLQAPAGSGKTTILAQRVLRLLAEVDSPEEILAVTFTRKAAAEMRRRIVEALSDGARESSAGASADSVIAAGSDVGRRTHELARAALARSRELGWHLDQHPARLRIQTIDGLNRALAASLPVASGAAAGTLPIAPEPARLYADAARRTLLDAEADPDLQEDSGRLLERLGNDWLRLEQLLAVMLARRNHWLRHVGSAPAQVLRERVEASLERLALGALARLGALLPRPLRDEGLTLVAHALASFAALGKPPPPAFAALRTATPDALGIAADDLPGWRALATLALTGDYSLRKRVNVTLGFGPQPAAMKARALQWIADVGAVDGAAEQLALALRLPEVRFDAVDADALGSLIELLRLAAAQLELIFREAGGVDFAAVAAAARQALRTDEHGSGVAIIEGVRLRHLLIDEFQDTSLEQFELVEALIRDWRDGDGRTFFAVGDPMQSIYQFREAEVGLFLRTRDAGIGALRLEYCQLTQNFRSTPQIVDMVNDTFAGVFAPADDPVDSAVRYHPSEATAPSAASTGSRVVIHRTDRAHVDDEAQRVLAIVQEYRARSPRTSIAVLVAARPHAGAIATALRAAGIPVRGVDLVPLVATPIVQDLVALTAAIWSTADRAAWVATLRAPWCGLGLDDLGRLAGHEPTAPLCDLADDPLRRQALSAQGLLRLDRVLPILRRAAGQAGRLPLARVVEAAWLALGGPIVCAAAQDVQDARLFFDALARRDAPGAWRGSADLDAMVDGLYAASEPVAAGGVEIMTIHRAKGLEYDCVILPGLHRRERHDDEPLFDWFEWPGAAGAPELLLAPIRPSHVEEAGSLARWIRDARRRRRRHERARLLYVAATRARSELHLLGSLAAQTGPDFDAADRSTAVAEPAADSALGILWPALGPAFQAAPLAGDSALPVGASALAAALQQATDPAQPALLSRRLRRLPLQWSLPELPATIGGRRIEVASVEGRDSPEFIWVGPMARHAGTVVHAEFERWVETGMPPDAAAVLRDAPRLERALRAEGIGSGDLPRALALVQRALQGALGDAHGRWLFARHPASDASELALSGLYEGRLTNVVVDRCFVDAEGVRWVVDYKTSSHQGGSLEAFLAAELERYLPQLRRYVALARGLGPEPVRAALYFPLLGRLVEATDAIRT